MKKIFLLMLLIGFMTATVNAQNGITVKVDGIENAKGKLYVALFDSQTPFLSKSDMGRIVDITNNTETLSFNDLGKGEYAIAIFQDENSNGKLDLGEYGIPVEKYGFSNNVDPAQVKRPPLFSECKFEVDGQTNISIHLVSAIK